jgi:hypothetical protein
MFKNLAINQQVSTVADREGFIYIVIGDKDTDVFVF